MHFISFSLALLLGLPWIDVAMARTPARVCRQSCAAAVDACVAEGRRPRACRRFVVRLCRREGVDACLTVPSTTTTRPLPTTTTSPTTTTTTRTTTSSTTSTTRAPQGLYGLLGTWDFTYSILSTYRDRYVMSSVSTLSDGTPYIGAYDVYGGRYDAAVMRPVDLGYTSFPFEFALLDAGPLVCDFFVFNKTGTNAVAGDYYLTDVDWDGTCSTILNLGDPYPMSGVRTAGVGGGIEAEAAETTAPDVGGLAAVLDQLR